MAIEENEKPSEGKQNAALSVKGAHGIETEKV